MRERWQLMLWRCLYSSLNAFQSSCHGLTCEHLCDEIRSPGGHGTMPSVGNTLIDSIENSCDHALVAWI